MQLVTFTESGRTRTGLKKPDGILDLSRAAKDLPTEMLALIQAGPAALDTARQKESEAADFAIEDVQLEAIIKRPPKVLGIGLNYRKHAEETGAKLPEVPLVFTKQSTSVTGPFDPIFWSEESSMLDYEGELAMVIGKNCRRVPKNRAREVILGFTIANDVSVRDWQKRGTPPSFTMGKSWDSHCPLGPAIVVDEGLDPHQLRIRTRVNEELRQDGSSSDLIFSCYELIEFLSTAFTLEAGDVILTGTPSGVGAAKNPPAWLQPGDRVQIEIEGLGQLENQVAKETAERASFF